MAQSPVDGDPDPKARGPQETPDKPEPNTEVDGAAGRIECGVRAWCGSPKCRQELARSALTLSNQGIQDLVEPAGTPVFFLFISVTTR